MSEKKRNKFQQLPVISSLVTLLQKIKIPGLNGMSLHDVLGIYGYGIIEGALTTRASAISFSFFMALFPFLLFVLNLIPFVLSPEYIPDFIANFTSLLPTGTENLFDEIIADIAKNRRGVLLYTTLVLALFLIANGVNAIFAGFENSIHVKINRNFYRQYIYALIIGIALSLLFIITLIVTIYFEIYVVDNLNDLGYLANDVFWINISKNAFFLIMMYLITAILYYFGTVEGKHTRFFSPGALLTTILILLTTYLFKIYITNFATYNELYGSIGALLILMLYIWINSIILLLGFELNATITRLKKRNA